MKTAKTIMLLCVAAALAPFGVQAGLTHSSSITTSGRKELKDGYVYTVEDDITIKGGNGLSAMYLAETSKAVLYIPTGVTLTLQGGAGTGTTGAGAGIEIPTGATLIVTGGGKLVAKGGKGANGEGGGDGENANVDGSGKPHDEWGRAGLGGAGGSGGGGAGAGIGGRGGAGGQGRAEVRKASNWHDTNGDWECKGYNGYSGYSGSKGNGCGTLYVLGTVQVSATGGDKGASGGGSGSNGSKDKEYWTLSYRAGGGGGGGGGGSGRSASGIGGGGGGGGAGGGGGEGSRYRTTQGYTYRSANGGHGGGGSGGVDGSGTRTDGEDGWFVGTGGNGGSGGSSGSTGDKGKIYRASSAPISSSSSYTATIVESHPDIEYTIKFDDGWRHTSSKTAKFGYKPPDGPTTSRFGYNFKGWYTNQDGSGEQYYNENGQTVKSVWTRAGNITLYPRWERNEFEDLSEAQLWINDSPISEGTDTSGTGWRYSGKDGAIYITGSNGTYDIKGRDLHGFATINVEANCTIVVSQTLEMEPGTRKNISPINLSNGVSATLNVTTSVRADAVCNLMGSSGNTSIRVPRNSSLTLLTTGVLNIWGGDGAADIGLNATDSEGGRIYVETYSHWGANIRPGHGLEINNGLLTTLGRGAKFFSKATGQPVWSVRMSELNLNDELKRMYLQRIDGDVHDDLRSDFTGSSWLWMPNGGYEWAEVQNASLKSNNLWVCYVENRHSAAEFFTPLHIEIDGDDIAHLTGKGWYSTRTSTTTAAGEASRATLVITNSGPHVVTGYGNAGIEIKCSTSLTISNLLLNVASWTDKAAIWLATNNNITLNLSIEGTNRLTSAGGRPGIFVGKNHTINIDGTGSMQVLGGTYGAGIGGCPSSAEDKRSGTINIKGGRITAVGGMNAAGLGGGATTGSNGAINITGGVTIARGGQYAAAIGGGYTGTANVNITGGTVFPTAGAKAYAIGAGYNAKNVTTKDKFGLAAIYTYSDLVSPAAIDSSNARVFPVIFDMGDVSYHVTSVAINRVSRDCNDLWTNERGELTLWLKSTGGELNTMTMLGVDDDGNVVKKSWGFKVEDNGKYGFSTDILNVDGEPLVGGVSADGDGWEYSKVTGELVFKSGSHVISGSATNGTIRIISDGPNVHLTIQKMTLKTRASELSPFVVSNRCTVALSGESIIECICNPNAKYKDQLGSEFTAAVEVTEGSSLTIEGDGTLTANGGLRGAGIGSRGRNLNAGAITINGGYIYAKGGSYRDFGGAGIGGGDGGGVASILVTGGYVSAIGGKNACGIGGGSGRDITHPDGMFRVTGGTVLAERGPGQVICDFVTSSGNTVIPAQGRSIVIDGGSVRPKNAEVLNTNPYPEPVNSHSNRLVFAVIDGLPAGDMLRLTNNLWPQYDGVDVLVDDEGAICLWGEYTNETCIIEAESENIIGQTMVFEINAVSNSIQTVESAAGGTPDSRKINGVDCWRVDVDSLPPGARLPVGGIDGAYSRGTTLSDYSGKTQLYLPNGEYDFTVSSYTYHASVNNAATTATFNVGILVNGVDIGTKDGPDWHYDGMLETLSLTNAVDYVISGTNTERLLSVCVETSGARIRANRLLLNPSDEGAIYTSERNVEFEFTGGTIETGAIPSRMVISGGSLEAEIATPVAPSGEAAHRVTIVGLSRYTKIEIENLEGLDGYDTSGIWSSGNGEVYMYLPDGDYYFRVNDGTSASDMIAIVDGEDETALHFTPTGVFIDGRDAARLHGDGWRNDDGLIRLTSQKKYVVSGTNDGAAVTFSVEKTGATIELTDLVMENDTMLASPFIIGGADNRVSTTVVLSGTNTISGVSDGQCAFQLAKGSLTIRGDGRLYATGGAGAAAIGTPLDAVDSGAGVVSIESGEISATGGSNCAGIGGAISRCTISGGVVTAQGGELGAGIGGNSGQNGFTINIDGGEVHAAGGTSGAGLGGGNNGAGGTVTVTNGFVLATGGSNGGAGIGGGNGGAPGNYRESGGTVVPRGADGGADVGAGYNGGAGTYSNYTTINGGSLDSSSANVTILAKNSSMDPVYCVTIPTGRSNFDISSVMTEYNGYQLGGVKSDDDGKVYLWLPNGEYFLNIGRVPFRAIVDSADTVAEPWSVGIEVNGEDAALQSGEGWTYGISSRTLSVFGDSTISGENTNGDAYIQFTNDVSIVVSNLVVTTTSSASASPFSVLSNATVALTIVGTNSFTATAEGLAGMNIPHGSTLSVTNHETVVSVPDLDNIEAYTNTIYDIEFDDNGDPKIDPDTGNVITNGFYYDIHEITNYLDTVLMPHLKAEGAKYAAGIGGGKAESHGTIHLLGGTIKATGGESGSGIGSGAFLDDGDAAADAATLRQGDITITGGEVSATGGMYGTGIGGGNRHSGGTITVSGGSVTAGSSEFGAGIGGGFGARGHTISISGGVVTAHGGNQGAGVGGGGESGQSAANTEPCKVTVSGGRVTALGGDGAAGIGSGYNDRQCAEVSITGGTVVAAGGAEPDGYRITDDIGAGSTIPSLIRTAYPLTINGASVHAMRRTSTDEYVAPAPSNGVSQVYCVTINAQCINSPAKVENLDGFDEDSEIYGDENGMIYVWLPDGTYIFYANNLPFTVTVDGADATATEWFTGITVDGVDVSWLESDNKNWGYDFETKTLTIIGDCVVSGTNTAGYVNILAGNVTEDEYSGGGADVTFTISNLNISASAPFCATNGAVQVTLEGENSITATDGSRAGMEVDSSAVLTISGGGSLEATGGAFGAGIGGGVNRSVGSIFISGGVITATGGDEGGAGIGGGFGASYTDEATIAISGGTILATGGQSSATKYAADIGDGLSNGENEPNKYRIVISGSSTQLTHEHFSQSNAASENIPYNESNARVYKVTMSSFTPNAPVNVELSGYGTNDIYADASGSIHLWLANGVYYYKADGVRYAMKLIDGTATTVEMPNAYGVMVDGVDVVNISGDAWGYDPFTDELSLTGDCTVSGTNTAAAIKVAVDTGVTISPSNLTISAADTGDDLLTGSGTVTITNGTAHLTGKTTCPVVLLGGSVKLNGSATIAFSNETARVYCVTVAALKPMSSIAIEGLPAYYGTSNIYADEDGKVFLWLENGMHLLKTTDEDATEREYIAHITGADADAEDLVLTGFTVNGRDVAYLSGEGWCYGEDSIIALSGLDNYELSGHLTNKFLNIGCDCALVVSNVEFNSFNVPETLDGIINIADAFNVGMTLIGENTVKAPASHTAGIAVPAGATLTISGEGSLTALAGKYAAGIGGGANTGCGTIIINGGTVVATGGEQGAGIGGGSASGSGTYAGDILITGGDVTATGGSWAAGIGGGNLTSGGSVEATGGKISAQGGIHAPAIGAGGSGGTYGDVTISGGTIVAVTNEFTFCLGSGRDTAETGNVTITGGSVNAAADKITPAPSNGVAAVSCVTIPGLTPNAAVAFDDLPDYYGTSSIYADADGQCYLWLPEDWQTSHTITPHPLTTSARRRLRAPTGTQHSLIANGYRYTVTISEEAGESVAEKGEALELTRLEIHDFAVDDGVLYIRFKASPSTWLYGYGFADTLSIAASPSLPIDGNPDAVLLDLSRGKIVLEDKDTATYAIPLDDDSLRFFVIEK